MGEEIRADVFVGPSVICFCHVFLLGSLRFNVIYPSELRLRDLLLLPSPRPVLRFVYAKSTNHRMKYKESGKQSPKVHSGYTILVSGSKSSQGPGWTQVNPSDSIMNEIPAN